MPIETRITGINNGDDNIVENTMHTRGYRSGMVVFSEPLIERSLYFGLPADENGSVEMAVDVTFGGTPEGIHDGTDSVLWTAAAISGTWDFASTTDPDAGTKCVEKVTTNTNDQAVFTDGTTTDLSGYTALTGRLRIEKFNSPYEILLQFRLAGVDVGNNINLFDFVNTGLIDSYQGFAIPKSAFGLALETIDELEITTINKPEFRLDTLQIEETGSPKVFTLTPPPGKIVAIHGIRFSFADDISSAVVNGTVMGLSYDKLMGLTELDNGILLQTVQNGQTTFAVNIRSVADLIKRGAEISAPISDGANTCVTFVSSFLEPIIQDSSKSDSTTITILDDLSGLLSFTALFTGKQVDL